MATRLTLLTDYVGHLMIIMPELSGLNLTPQAICLSCLPCIIKSVMTGRGTTRRLKIDLQFIGLCVCKTSPKSQLST
jgi:hypothetical protein